MRNGYIIEIITTVDKQEIENVGGNLLKDYEGLYENLKRRHLENLLNFI